MQTENSRNETDFGMRLVVDRDRDLAVEVSHFSMSDVPHVEIVKLKNIARENFRYVHFVGAVMNQGVELSDALQKPFRFGNEKE